MKSKRICALITFALIITSVSPALASTQSLFPTETDVVTVANNFAGAQDTITFNGKYFSAGDVVKVYSDSSKATEIGLPATVNLYQDDVIISFDQLGQTSGSVYVTLQDAAGDAESDVVTIPYGPEVTAINNVDKADTVTFNGLKANDIAKVYAMDGSTLLGQATAAVTGDVTVTLTNPLSESDLSVKVTVTSNGIESSKTPITYSGNVKTSAPLATDIIVANNVDIADKVTFLGLKAKDVATVYAGDKTTVLGQATAVNDGSIIVTLGVQLSESTKQIYVTVKSDGQLESNQTLVQYFREVITTAPLNTDITVTNNAVGTADTVVVPGLAVGDIVKVYSAATGGITIGTGTATVAGALTVSISQLGAAGGNIYVSLTSKNMIESDRTAAVSYIAEAKSTTPDTANITVTNNTTGTPDTVKVTGLAVGDIVKVYSVATGGTAIGTATVATGATSATVTVTQLGAAAGNVYVSVTSKALLESDTTVGVAYIAEPKSTTPDPTTIVVTNNAVGTADTVVVPSLAVGDIVKVYSAATGGVAIGTSTAVTVAGSVTLNIAQLGAAGGNVYVSLISKGKLESDRTVAVAYAAEAKSTTLDTTKITVTNNLTGTADTVKVTGLAAGDIVKVYSVATGGTAIGTATVATGATSATVTITQLGTAAGSIYLSLTSKTLLESDRTVEIAYIAEPKSATPDTTKITTHNYAGISDVITVTGLSVGDIVKVYSVATGGTAMVTSKAIAIGKIGISFNVAQLGTAAGNVYLTVTSTGKLESDRTVAVAFAAEP